MAAAGVRRCFVDGEYGQLHLRVAGRATAKPAIVCLHMVPKSGRSFANVMPLLARDRLVLAPDYPGYGESDHPPAAPEVSIEDYARAVWQVVDHWRPGAVDFVGYHTGSMVALAAARQRPGAVAKIINISAPIFTAAELEQYRRYFAPIALDTGGERFRVMWERIMHYRGPGMTLAMAADSMAENLRGGDHYEWGHRAAFNHAEAYVRHLRELQQPLLVMNINDDLYAHSRRVDTLLNNGERRDFPDWGNGFLDVRPEPVAATMLNFFDAAFSRRSKGND
ncbi:alpha/beta hydrolase [Exilibacterium tricleocarpae]|uniref:Alpha/beta hydrolase n=1 Tax=Exilibacterium tricleocarpae TaxID=2591008 RepID=A0A545T629_9GAMM|nr:alpha/beta fold hydrolase [Exilibacterium tricleocarpae]TQV72622.1 alpha/beta hydrolase [Exilibacterium tricleocarpae]